MAIRRLTLGACAALLVAAAPAAAAAIVQQAKLTAPDEIGADARLGNSVAISGNGDTALVGGWTDNDDAGAAWVYARTGTSWREVQKLTVTDESSEARFGSAVALSADGNTALISGDENTSGGAAWIFVRSQTTGTWTEQKMLTGVGGVSVSLSSDGNTALIGNTSAGNDFTGNARIYTRSGTTWSQFGSTLAPNDADPSGLAHFGSAVALSGDGNTALIGGDEDGFGGGNGEESPGAAWIFTRSASGFSQDGSKLVPSDESSDDAADFGNSVAISNDGSTALIGGPGDGYAWVYTRSGSTYSELDRFTGNDVTGGQFGGAVSLSADGSTALIGDDGDGTPDVNENYPGAAWEFSRQGSAFVQDGAKFLPAGDTDSEFGSSVAISGDANTALIGGVFDGITYPAPPNPPEPTLPGAAWIYVSPPTASSIGPSSGPAAGGTSIVIVGDNFTGTTSVTIGGKPATFSVGSPEALIVKTPAGTGKAPIVVTTAATSATVGTFTYIPPAPALTKFSESHKTWRLGSKLASISRAKKKPPTGTTFSFTLSEAATLQLAFKRGNKGAGTLKLSARAGKDKLAFDGRLTRKQKLKPGSYTVTITATLDGKSSKQSRLSFKIASG
jgi:IPT/TIG domain/FG-GAP repeat